MLGDQEASQSPFLRALRLLAAFALLAALVPAALASRSAAAPGSGLERAIEVQDRNSDRLLARGAIVGAGVGLDESGTAEIVVLAERGVRVAETLGGVPVELTVTGAITSAKAAPRKKPDNPGKGNGNGGGNGGGGEGGEEAEPSLSTTDLWPRPVPIGISTGNAKECAAGTIGARVSDGAGGVYALSNNHVYARENAASLGEEILQPGRYDTSCAIAAESHLGTLSDYEELDFEGGANLMDAAIALTPAGTLCVATPSGGYGAPSSTSVEAALGAPVQKFGRTTGLTEGRVVVVNADVEVGYGSGVARFEDQIWVEGRKPFLKSGDSGSLLVSDDVTASPVGLLFAGNSSGKFAVASPIQPILDAFGVTIDSE